VSRRDRPGPQAEDGQALVLLVGLVVLVLVVLALGWDTSNWFLGHRALANLADGAAVAAAGEVDVGAWYASGGREVRVVEGRARATVGAYLAGSAGDSGVGGAAGVGFGGGGPRRAGGDGGGGGAGAGGVAAGVAPPLMEGRASATARLLEP
jgi:hypothetical protein